MSTEPSFADELRQYIHDVVRPIIDTADGESLNVAVAVHTAESVVLRVTVCDSSMGRVIGTRGATADAIRGLALARAHRAGYRGRVDVRVGDGALSSRGPAPRV